MNKLIVIMSIISSVFAYDLKWDFSSDFSECSPSDLPKLCSSCSNDDIEDNIRCAEERSNYNVTTCQSHHQYQGPTSINEYYDMHQLPSSVEAANLNFDSRKRNIVVASILSLGYLEYKKTGQFEFKPEHWLISSKYLANISAATHFLSNVTDFTDEEQRVLLTILSGLPESSLLHEHKEAFSEKLSKILSNISQFETVGSDIGSNSTIWRNEDGLWRGHKCSNKVKGDYDFILQELVNLLFLNIENTDLLSNDDIWKILSHSNSLSDDGGVFYSPLTKSYIGRIPGMLENMDPYTQLSYFVVNDWDFDPDVNISQPETENHLILLFAWTYLAREYITWVKDLPIGHPRYSSKIKGLYESNPSLYSNSGKTKQYIINMLGRIPNWGLFETSARPYESITTSGLLTFYSFSNMLIKNYRNEQIKGHAEAALNYISAKFAFQSFEGKRVNSARRNYKYKNRIGKNVNDYLPYMLGVLSGSYVFDDNNGFDSFDLSYVPKDNFVNRPFHFATLGQSGKFSTWAALLDYRIPPMIHDFMLNKYNGYEAKFLTEYTLSEHNLDIEKGNFTADDSRFTPPDYGYFFGYQENSGTINPFKRNQSNVRRVKHQVYATQDYLNSGGGYFVDYFPFENHGPITCVDNENNDWYNLFEYDCNQKELEYFNTMSSPLTVIGKGYYPKDISAIKDDEQTIEEFEKQNPTMRGQINKFWASQNHGIHKNVSIGYGTSGTSDRHLEWPQRYPSCWDNLVTETISIGRASFKVFDLTKSSEFCSAKVGNRFPNSYLIAGKFSRSADRGRDRNYSRGLWEIVDSKLYDSPEDLLDYIKSVNPTSHFQDKDIDFKYTTTNLETLKFEYRFGSSSTRGKTKLISVDKTYDYVDPWLKSELNSNSNPDGTTTLFNNFVGGGPLMEVVAMDYSHGYLDFKYALSVYGRLRVNSPVYGSLIQNMYDPERYSIRYDKSKIHYLIELSPITTLPYQIASQVNISSKSFSKNQRLDQFSVKLGNNTFITPDEIDDGELKFTIPDGTPVGFLNLSIEYEGQESENSLSIYVSNIWSESKSYSKNDVVNVGNKECIAKIDPTPWPGISPDSPQLWSVWKCAMPTSTDVYKWSKGSQYTQNDRVLITGHECTLTHSSNAGWTNISPLDPSMHAVWSCVKSDDSFMNWNQGVTYFKGDMTLYNGNVYEMIHHSNSGWEMMEPNDPTLWAVWKRI